jgi:hypothetical protein
VVATLALFAALGGSSVAAVSLGRNSVGTRQIARGAVHNSDLARSSVTSSKVRNGSLQGLDFKAGQLPSGARGATGATGPRGTPGTNGTNGTNGVDGRSALTPLRRDETERGVFGFEDGSAVVGEIISTFVSLPIPSAVALDSAHVNVAGKDDGGVCTGSFANPTAPVGFVCIYVSSSSNIASGDPQGTSPGIVATPYGFEVSGDDSVAGDAFAEGDWAYTAA